MRAVIQTEPLIPLQDVAGDVHVEVAVEVPLVGREGHVAGVRRREAVLFQEGQVLVDLLDALPDGVGRGMRHERHDLGYDFRRLI